MEVGPLPPFIIVDGYRFTRVEDFKTRNLNWLCAASTRCTATVRTDKTGSKVLRKIGVHRRCRRVPEEEQQQAVEDEARRFLPGIEYRPIMAEVKGFITCTLCNGYLIDATTITGCLHTFCRSCIIKHLEEKRFCPKCNMYLPHENGDYTEKAILLDKTVQTLVYKLVPGLYKSESERRLKATKDLKTHVDPVNLPLVSPDDTIHISIEYSRSTADGVDVVKNEANETVLGKRYLKCPSAVTIRILKRFIRMKYGIQEDWRVEIFYNGESMNDNFSLADMIYTFGNVEDVPIAFSYQVYLEKTLPIHSPNKHHVTQKENTETSTFDGKSDVVSPMQQFSKSTSKSAELSALLAGTPKVRLVTKRHGKRKKRHGAGTTGHTSKRLKVLVSKLSAVGEKSDVSPSDEDHTVLPVFQIQTAKAINGTLAAKYEDKPLMPQSDINQIKNATQENMSQIILSENTNTERILRCRSKKPTNELSKLPESKTAVKPRRSRRKYENIDKITVAENSKSLENVEPEVTSASTVSEIKSAEISPPDAGSLEVRNNTMRKSRRNTFTNPYSTFVYTGKKLVNKHWLNSTSMKLSNRYFISKPKQHRTLVKRIKKTVKKELCEISKTISENTQHINETTTALKSRRNSCKAIKMSENVSSSLDGSKSNLENKISDDNEIPQDVQVHESNSSQSLCSNNNVDCSKNDISVELQPKSTTSENKKSNDDCLQTAGRQYNEKCNNLKRIIDVVKSNTSPKPRDNSVKSEITTGSRQNELESVPSISETDSKTDSKVGISENIGLSKPGLEVTTNNKYNFFNNKSNSSNIDCLTFGTDAKGVSAINSNGDQDDANAIKNVAFEFSEEEDDEVELVLRISDSEDDQNQSEINTDYEFFNNKNVRSCQPNRKTKLDSEESDNCKKSKLIEESAQIKKENRNKNEEKNSTNNPCLNPEDATEVSENGLKTMIKSNHRNNVFAPDAVGKKSVCEIKLPMKESNKLTASNILANSNRNDSCKNQMRKSTFEKDSQQVKVQNKLCSFGFNGNNSTAIPKYMNISNSTSESTPSEESNAPIKCEVKPDVPKELSQISCKTSGIDVMKPKSSEGKLSAKLIPSKELLLPFTLSVAKNDMKQTSDNVDVTLKPSLEILPLNPVETDSSSNKGYASHTSSIDYTKLIPKKPRRDLRKPPPPIPIVRISKIDELLSEISQASIKREVKEGQTKSSEMKVHVENMSGGNDVGDRRIKSEVLDLSKKSTRSRHPNSTVIFPNHVNMIKNPHVSSEHKFSYPRSASTLSPPISVRSSPPTPKTSPTLSDGSFDTGYNIHSNETSPIVTDISPARNSNNISKALDNARSSALINTLSSAAVSKDYHLHSAIAVLNRERMCGASVNVRPCDFPPSQRMVPNKMNDKVFKSLSEKNPKLERSKSTGSLHMNHPQACPDSFPKFYPDPRSPILSPTQTAFRESPILARHITGRLAKAEQPKEANCFKGSNGKTKTETSEYFASDAGVSKSPMMLNVSRIPPPLKKPVHGPYPGSTAPKSNRKYNVNTFVPNSVDSYENLEDSPRSLPNKKLKFHDKSPPAESFPQTNLPFIGYSAVAPSKRSEAMKNQTIPSITPNRRLQMDNSVPRQEIEVKKLNHASNYNHVKSMMNKQQNQTIRHIPNPSALTFRQQRSNSNVSSDANSGNHSEQNSQRKKQNVVTEMRAVEEDQDSKNVIQTDDSNSRGKNSLPDSISKSSDSKNIVLSHSRPETPNSVNYGLANNDTKYGTLNRSFSESFQTVRNRNNYGRSKTPTPELSYGEKNKNLYNRRSKTPTPDLSTYEKNNNEANKNLNPFVLLPIISDVRSLATGDFNNSEKAFKSKRRNSALTEN